MKALRLSTLLLLTLLAGCAQHLTFSLNDLPDFYPQPDNSESPTPQSPAEAAGRIDNIAFRTLSKSSLDYFERFLADNMHSRQIAIQLRNLIHSPAFLDYEYADDKTYNAQQTYDKAQGNCIAYSHLYLSLARHFGLNAHYQLIDSDPTMVLRDKKISLAIHVNVVVKLNDGSSFTADTVPRQQHLIKKGVIISDDSADALHYNNLAIDAMYKNDYLRSYQYLAKALSLDSSLSLLWSNAGAIFRKNQQFDAAEASLQIALALDSNAYPALNNLAVLYHRQGDAIRSQYYLNKIQAYRERNPYHHYNLALLDIGKQNYTSALKLIKKAIRLKSDESDFYYQQSLIYQHLNNLEQSLQAIDLAIANSNDRKQQLKLQTQRRQIEVKQPTDNPEH